MKVYVQVLTPLALDWAAGKCEEVHGMKIFVHPDFPYVGNEKGRWSPSTDWGQGGPIIEQNWVDIHNGMEFLIGPEWPRSILMTAPDTLSWFMRAYVCVKLGPEIEVPEELMK